MKIKVLQDFLLGFLFRASNECEFLSKFQDSCKIVICAKSKVDLGFYYTVHDMNDISISKRVTPFIFHWRIAKERKILLCLAIMQTKYFQESQMSKTQMTIQSFG